MYHLRASPVPTHATRFNLTEQQLRAVLGPWVRGKIVEVGERKWTPEQATLTVLEGPELGLGAAGDGPRMARGGAPAART